MLVSVKNLLMEFWVQFHSVGLNDITCCLKVAFTLYALNLGKESSKKFTKA